MKAYVIKLILSTFLIIGIHADKSKDSKDSTEWTCESDGFWYANGKKTQYSNCGGDDKDGSSSSNKDKKSEACTESTNPGMPSSFPKTCINGPPDQGLRCWWTYIPASVKKLDSCVKVPLVIDMHGGGGCASHQALSSGFRELADSLSGKDSFITVWPQGYGYQWGTCGSDCAAAQAKQASSGKTVHSVDDLTFLASMIAYIVKSDSSDNPSKTRVDKRANAYDALGDLPILQSSGVTSFNVNIYMTVMVLIIGCFLNLKT